MLTTRQQELLEFIKEFVKKHSFSPTHREIMKALNIKSYSYLTRVLDKLEDLGLIKRKEKGTKNNIELMNSPFSIPILGEIAAGHPIEAITQPDENIMVRELLGGNRYLLRVKGDSMIEENICAGDLVICESCQRVPNGTIVIALVNGQEATLKRIYYKDNKIHLKPANNNYNTQIYEPNQVQIQGRFVGLLRLQ